MTDRDAGHHRGNQNYLTMARNLAVYLLLPALFSQGKHKIKDALIGCSCYWLLRICKLIEDFHTFFLLLLSSILKGETKQFIGFEFSFLQNLDSSTGTVGVVEKPFWFHGRSVDLPEDDSGRLSTRTRICTKILLAPTVLLGGGGGLSASQLQCVCVKISSLD